MKALLSILWLVILSFPAVAVEYQVKHKNTGPPMGVNAYEFKETWTLQVTLLPLGTLPASSSITIKNLADGTTTTRSVSAQGVISNPTLPYSVPNLNAGATKVYQFAIIPSWDPNTVQQMQANITFRRVDSTTSPSANVNKTAYQTLFVKGPDLELGQWNLVINTRSRIDTGVDYLVQWANFEADIWSVEAKNPPSNQTNLFSHDEYVDPELAPTRTVKVWKRVRPGAWVQIAAAVCPYMGTLYLNDYPNEQTPEDPPAPEDQTQPPDTAQQVGSGGAGTGTTTGTGGTGYGSGTGPGTSSGSSSGSGGSGGSGEGGEEAGDATGAVTLPDVPSTANLDGTSGLLDTYLAQVQAATATISAHLTTIEAIEAGVQGALAAPLMPSIVGSWDYKFPLHVGAMSFNVDLSAYQSLFVWVRQFLLAIVTATFWFRMVKLMKEAVAK